MSKTDVEESPAVVTAGIAAALAALRALLLAGYVKVAAQWQDHGSGPGSTSGRMVEVTILSDPAALDALLRGMTNVDGPTYWEGSHYGYNEWRGDLLTMPILVSERLNLRPTDGPGQASCADHPDFVPDSLHHLREHIEDLHADELAGADGPDRHDQLHGAQLEAEMNAEPDPGLMVRPYIAGDPLPLLDLVRAERFGPVPVPVVPGPPPGAEDSSAEAAWSRYSMGRARLYFGDRRFPSTADALDAVRYWPGFDILLPGDVQTLADELVDPLMPAPLAEPFMPAPAPPAGRRPVRRLFGRQAS